jgi:tRNA-2-methylthio-N6-dimethylallyladenosine synthase
VKPYQVETLIRNPGISTFVNIAKGCDNFCTFCVVPYTRGRERSRALAELVKDVNTLTKRGVKEVTLLGQNVNSYKSECGANFGQLLKTMATDTDLLRIRYTTSHPKDFNEELVDISQQHRDKICDYIHLPAQSGNTEVLERMNRGYSREDYLKKVEMIRKAIPGVTLSTDIIVGFPGETAAQFEDTLSMVRDVRYDNIYAFKYSPRPFTKAAKWEDNTSDEEKSERLERLFALQRPISAELATECLGQTYEVLVEEVKADGRAFGRTSANRPVLFPFTGRPGDLARVKISVARPMMMEGTLIET